MSMTDTTGITVTWEGRTAWTAGSHLPVTWGGRIAMTASSHTPITITFRRLEVGVRGSRGENLVQPVVDVVTGRGRRDLGERLLLVVHGDGGSR